MLVDNFLEPIHLKTSVFYRFIIYVFFCLLFGKRHILIFCIKYIIGLLLVKKPFLENECFSILKYICVRLDKNFDVKL